MSMFDDVKAFHEKFNMDYKGRPRALDLARLQARLKFLREEMNEYEGHADAALDELSAPSFDRLAYMFCLAGMVDALMDMIYVALGTAHLQGFDVQKAWDKVHQANMAKERRDGEPQTVEGVVKLNLIKPPGWQPPDHLDEVLDYEPPKGS